MNNFRTFSILSQKVIFIENKNLFSEKPKMVLFKILLHRYGKPFLHA